MKLGCIPPKVTIRAATYRGREGFEVRAVAQEPAVVSEGRRYEWPPHRIGPIFAWTRKGAEAIRDALRRCDDEAVSRILLEGR